MQLAEIMDIQGRLTVQKYDLHDHLIEEVKAKNSIVVTGRELVARLFMAESIKPISKVAVGTGNNPVQPNDKTLNKQIFAKAIKRKDLQSVQQSAADGQKLDRKKVVIAIDLDPDEANETLQEAGLFNEDGVMYNRVVFASPINKSKDFKLTLVWEIIF